MLYRLLPLSLLALALALFASTPVRADKGDKGDTKADANQMEGKFVEAEVTNKLVMTDKEGKNEHTHTLAADAKISCDGKECKLSDLKKNVLIRVTLDPDKKVATRIEATTKGSFDKDSKDKDNK
jgi:hypothetical protein